MPLSVELIHTGGRYPQVVAEHLSRVGGQPVVEHRLPPASSLPLMIDDPEEYLPADLGQADIAIAIHLHHDLLVELPAVLGGKRTKALLVPIESPDWMVRPGLSAQVARECQRFGLESAFPKPFCGLVPGTPAIRQFCKEYRVGRLEFAIEVRNGRVVRVEAVRGSPCGLTDWVAERLVGTPTEELVARAAELLHLRPCLATMMLDPQLGDTIMHESIRLIEAAARNALASA
jgi:thymidylate synthase